jgi:hypothetical protein
MTNAPKKIATWSGFVEDEDLEPVVGTERTDNGWRGITADGEIFEVEAPSGTIPESILVFADGQPLGRRTVSDEVVDVTAYLEAFNRAIANHRAGLDVLALAEINEAIAIVSTSRARYNRAMMLLALGRWREGFEEYELCEREPTFIRPNTKQAIAAGKVPWRGEPLTGKRLLVVHDHGFGDTVMMLRFVEGLRRCGAQIALAVPSELARIAMQFGEVYANSARVIDCDYFTSFLQLMRWLEIEPGDVPRGAYIQVDPGLAASWRDQLGRSDRRRVGVAWSTRITHSGDFPRELPLEQMLGKLSHGYSDVEFHSVQKQGADEAHTLGVVTHDLADFASAAALMSVLDEVVSVDTAAIHVAGAIGHPHATVLLPKWHSWRWHGNPFYPNVRIEASGR